jgi:hypothetical protein
MKGLSSLIAFLWITLASVIFPLHAQIIRVSSELSSDSLMIGDQLIYSLNVDAAEEVEFLLPALRDSLGKNLEILSPLGSDTTLLEGRRMVKQNYLITGFEAGMSVVPAQEVSYRFGDLTDTARSMPLMIRVHEPVVDTSQQIKPIKPPINTPLTLKELLPWLGIGLGSLLMAFILYLTLRKYFRSKGGTEEISNEVLEPAHIIAFRDLDKLKEEKIWEEGKVKLYYTQLTEITRTYIERQYGIPAMESTTDEILQAFRKSNPEDTLLDEILQELLELADLVKFAKEDPLPVDNQTNLNNAYIFVQKTYPQFYREEVKDE